MTKLADTSHTRETTHHGYIMVTHQLSPHTVEIPVPKGIHYIELIRHLNTTTSTGTLVRRRSAPHIGCQFLHRGGLWTTKSFICAQGISLQMTEITNIELLLKFI